MHHFQSPREVELLSGLSVPMDERYSYSDAISSLQLKRRLAPSAHHQQTGSCLLTERARAPTNASFLFTRKTCGNHAIAVVDSKGLCASTSCIPPRNGFRRKGCLSPFVCTVHRSLPSKLKHARNSQYARQQRQSLRVLYCHSGLNTRTT